jgi:hypothetical protein
MITLNEIRIAVSAKDYTGLRDLHTRARAEPIEGCDDEHKHATLSLNMIECAAFRGTSQAHTLTLNVMLDAIERGNHPYDDAEASANMDASAAIAQAQITALVGKGA